MKYFPQNTYQGVWYILHTKYIIIFTLYYYYIILYYIYYLAI